jgi:hypothetical protein
MKILQSRAFFLIKYKGNDKKQLETFYRYQVKLLNAEEPSFSDFSMRLPPSLRSAFCLRFRT